MSKEVIYLTNDYEKIPLWNILQIIIETKRLKQSELKKSLKSKMQNLRANSNRQISVDPIFVSTFERVGV